MEKDNLKKEEIKRYINYLEGLAKNSKKLDTVKIAKKNELY